MITQLSLPTWFMSLSAADTRWTDLLRMLAKLIDGIEYSEKELDAMTWQEKSKLVQKNPPMLNDHLFGKELFILFAASAFRKLSSIYVFSYFPFGFEGGIWDLIVSVSDHCLSFYFAIQSKAWNKI